MVILFLFFELYRFEWCNEGAGKALGFGIPPGVWMGNYGVVEGVASRALSSGCGEFGSSMSASCFEVFAGEPTDGSQECQGDCAIVIGEYFIFWDASGGDE